MGYRVAVVGGIGEHMLGPQSVQQRRGLRGVAALAGRNDHPTQPAVLAHAGVELSRQPAAGSAQAASRVGVFFFSSGKRQPVEAVGWALMLVESSCNSSNVSSAGAASPNAAATRSHTPEAHQRSYRFHTVLGLPKRSGRSSQGMPVFRT